MLKVIEYIDGIESSLYKRAAKDAAQGMSLKELNSIYNALGISRRKLASIYQNNNQRTLVHACAQLLLDQAQEQSHYVNNKDVAIALLRVFYRNSADYRDTFSRRETSAIRKAVLNRCYYLAKKIGQPFMVCPDYLHGVKNVRTKETNVMKRTELKRRKETYVRAYERLTPADQRAYAPTATLEVKFREAFQNIKQDMLLSDLYASDDPKDRAKLKSLKQGSQSRIEKLEKQQAKGLPLSVPIDYIIEKRAKLDQGA